MAHIAIAIAIAIVVGDGDGDGMTWLEPVSDEQYDQALRATDKVR